MDTNFKLSQYQEDILNNIKTTNNNLLIDAKAGSGKTSTLLLATQCLEQNNQDDFIYLAFNKDIVKELQKHLTESNSSKVKTIHSLGYSFLASDLYRRYNTNYKMDMNYFGKTDKTTYLCKEYYNTFMKDRVSAYLGSNLSEKDLKRKHTVFINTFATICKFCKYYCIDISNEQEVRKQMESMCSGELLELIQSDFLIDAYKIVEQVINKGVDLYLHPTEKTPDGKYIIPVEFDDFIYIPVRLDLKIPYKINNTIGTVFIDECIPGDYYIQTNKGNIKFKKLHQIVTKNNKIKVKTYNEKTNNIEYKPVIDVVDKGIKDTFIITLNQGLKIEATGNHKFMTQNGWKNCSDLIVGEDYLCLDYINKYKTKEDLPYTNVNRSQFIIGLLFMQNMNKKNSTYTIFKKLNETDITDNVYKCIYVTSKDNIEYVKNIIKLLQLNDDEYKIENGKDSNEINVIFNKLCINRQIDQIIKYDLNIIGLTNIIMNIMYDKNKPHYNTLYVSKAGITEKSLKAFCDKFKEYNIDIKVTNLKIEPYYKIKILNSVEELQKIIGKYIIPGHMYYKTWNTYNINTYFKQIGLGNVNLHLCKISSIEASKEPKRVYDASIKDNHNFFITSHKFSKYHVLAHNCQDLSLLQQMLVKKLNKYDNRFIFVGDKNQSIYGFNGADFKSIDRIQSNFRTKQLPLNICYRCPAKIVELAKDIVPNLEYNKDRSDKGILDAITYKEMKEQIQPNDVIIARYNKDLVKIYKDFILHSDKKIKFKNQSLVSSIKNGIINSIHEYISKYNNYANIDKMVRDHMDEFIENLHTSGANITNAIKRDEANRFIENYIKEERPKIKKKIMKSNFTLDYLKNAMNEFKTQGAYNYEVSNLSEYYDTILEFIKDFSNKSSSILVSDLENYIEEIFDYSKFATNTPILGSIHSMKGDEADNIYIYNYPLFPYINSGMDEDEQQQEKNLQYVAITRAKRSLHLIKAEESDRLDKIRANRMNILLEMKIADINRMY